MTRFQMIEKRMSDEEGDSKFHSKKDDALGAEKCGACGGKHGFTKQSDGTIKCQSCGKTMKPVRLESTGVQTCTKCGQPMVGIGKNAKCPNDKCPSNKDIAEACGKASCSCTPETCKCKKGKKCDCASVPQKQYNDEFPKKKKSKFESYEADVILEKLGSLDAMDASELGVPANTPITIDMLKSAFKRIFMKTKDADPNGYYTKIKSALKGVTPEELALIRKQLENAVINVGGKNPSGDGFGSRRS